MYHFNPSLRELNIDLLLDEYENILLQTGILTRLNKHFVNHKIHDGLNIPSIILEEEKKAENSQPEQLSDELQEYANEDPIRIAVKCPENKEFNPKTKRCVKKCKPGYQRNSDFKCIKTKKIREKSKSKSINSNSHHNSQINHGKICPDNKELNPSTNRCVNKCKPGYQRNLDFKCVKQQTKKAKEKSMSIHNSHSHNSQRNHDKICPADKELNPSTNRCVKKCNPGYKRNLDFKCVKQTKKQKS